jgi:hypothetical protein
VVLAALQMVLLEQPIQAVAVADVRLALVVQAALAS